LLDFGVAAPLPARTPVGAAARATSSPGSRRGTFVGTPAYASPEQASGDPVDHTTDLYAVGVMLYELACGRLPFEGWSAGELLIQHMSAPAPRLPAEVCATPLGRALDAIVQGCMAKEPLDRFSSAAELAARLASDGALLGVTPFRRAFPRRDAVAIVEISHAGYEPVRLEVSTSATRTVNVLLAASSARPARPRRPERLGSEKTIDPFPR